MTFPMTFHSARRDASRSPAFPGRRSPDVSGPIPASCGAGGMWGCGPALSTRRDCWNRPTNRASAAGSPAAPAGRTSSTSWIPNLPGRVASQRAVGNMTASTMRRKDDDGDPEGLSCGPKEGAAGGLRRTRLPEVDDGTRIAMGTGDVDKPAMMVELEELDLALDELRQVFDAEDGKARLVLRRLGEDGADLARLDEMLSGWRDEVDVFSTLGLDGSEEFHLPRLAAGSQWNPRAGRSFPAGVSRGQQRITRHPRRGPAEHDHAKGEEPRTRWGVRSTGHLDSQRERRFHLHH